MELEEEFDCERRVNRGFDKPRSSLLESRTCLRISLIFFLFLNNALRAEPWIDTRDKFLRADIELLADVGVIKVPITTYPLMWSGIIKDLDDTDTLSIPREYKDVYWRVRNAGRDALSQKASREVRLSASNSEQVLRSFGDLTRGKAELAARSHRMTKRFAWNAEVIQVKDPADGKETRYDGSYIGVVLGNWILSVGAVEKWWGPGWDSSTIVSNNARPPIGVMFQRNYSNKLDIPIVDWLGPWTFSTFVAELDKDKNIEKDAKITGVSFNFKPHRSLELGVRVSALWGADDQPESFDSLVDSLVGFESCQLEEAPAEIDCSEFFSEKGDRLAGIDFRWNLPVGIPISLYGSSYGEDETRVLPTKTIKQLGLTSTSRVFNTNWKWFVEYSETTLGGDEFNKAYESEVYETGYRFFSRAIGSTYDNDSEVLSFGILGAINRQNKFSLKLSDIELNIDGANASELGLHSITESHQKFKRIKFDWIHITREYGEIELSLDYSDNVYDEFDRRNDEVRFGVGWKYQLQ